MSQTNRVSALKRLGNPSPTNNLNRRQLIRAKNSPINDARQILVNRNKTSFDARQLLNRQASNVAPKNIIVRKNLLQTNDEMNNNGKVVVVTGLKNMRIRDGKFISTATTGNSQMEKNKNIFAVGPSTFVTFRNDNNTNTSLNRSTDKVSLTKTITNSSARREDDDRLSQTTNSLSSLSDKKLVVRFVNDEYEKNPTSSQSSITSSSIPQRAPLRPAIKRLHDASIQTISSPTPSRSPIRTNSHRRKSVTTIDDLDHMSTEPMEDDIYEPPVKRTTTSTRKTTTSNKEQQPVPTGAPASAPVKRAPTGAPVGSRIASSISAVTKSTPTKQSNSISGTILVTNLQPSVTEDDVIELFTEIGRINEITTLSQGCVQITYAKREHAEEAVTKYHNRLLDGQFMYVSLQQPKPSSNNSQPTKENGSSNNSSSTTHQPLKLNTNNTTSNKITIDPTFFRQALFHPTNNTTNPVQFQVKL